MPVPQEINFIVEQASCLFLTMVQDVSLKKNLIQNTGTHCFINSSLLPGAS